MKKYNLWLNSTSFIEYSEDDFKKLSEINITGLEDNLIVKAKEFKIKNPRWKYEAVVIVPIVNFEVIDDMENN